GYSRFNLEALFELATLAEHVGVDLWHYQTADGRSMQQALEFLLPYVDVPPKKWPYGQTKTPDPAGVAPILRQTAAVYHEPNYEAIVQKFSGQEENRMQLLCAPPKAALR